MRIILAQTAIIRFYDLQGLQRLYGRIGAAGVLP